MKTVLFVQLVSIWTFDNGNGKISLICSLFSNFVQKQNQNIEILNLIFQYIKKNNKKTTTKNPNNISKKSNNKNKNKITHGYMDLELFVRS